MFREEPQNPFLVFRETSEFALTCAARRAIAAARAALLSPPDLSPTGADGVFVPDNRVITFNLNRLPAEKKTEGLQHQKGSDSCLVSRENLEGRGPGDSSVSSRRGPDGGG